MLTAATDTVSGVDLDAHQPYTVNEVTTVSATFDGLAAVEHVVDMGRATVGTTFAHVDFTRTTNADGSFRETGSVGANEMHALAVNADFSAALHDETPGFSLRDVTVAAPDGPGPTRTST